MSYFLDTNILVYYLKGMHDIARILTNNAPSFYKIPAIVKAELLAGAYKSQRKDHNLRMIHDVLSVFDVIPFNNEATHCFAEIKSDLEQKGTPIGPYDLLIAATVLAHNGILVTNNTQEFSRVKGLTIENWVT